MGINNYGFGGAGNALLWYNGAATSVGNGTALLSFYVKAISGADEGVAVAARGLSGTFGFSTFYSSAGWGKYQCVIYSALPYFTIIMGTSGSICIDNISFRPYRVP
jgi:hypothetical protein